MDDQQVQKLFPTSLVISKIKTRMSYTCASIRMATVKQLSIESVSEDMEQLECSYTAGVNAK